MSERSSRMNNCDTWSLAAAFTRRQNCSLSRFSGLFLRADPAFSWGFLLVFEAVETHLFVSCPRTWLNAFIPGCFETIWRSLSKKCCSYLNVNLMSEHSALKHFYRYLRWMQFLSCCLQVAIQLHTSALLYTECLDELDWGLVYFVCFPFLFWCAYCFQIICEFKVTVAL